jgi:hypothetical protein
MSSSNGPGPSGALVKIKVDASKEGCSGMFWRTKPEMNATSNASDWPRNGTVLDGAYNAEKTWAHFSNGFWLPRMQNGVQILHDV